MKKKIILILCLFLMFIYKVNALSSDNYSNVTTFTNNYLAQKNYTKYNNYLLIESGMKYSFLSGNVALNSKFINGGLVNKEEYEIAGGPSSYLDHSEYFWSMTESGTNTYVISKNSYEANTSSYGARVTEYMKPRVKVTGQGTQVNPWKFKDIITITLTFDNQGATTPGTTAIDVVYTENFPKITIPTKTSYVFDGYYTASNGGGTKYYNADGTPTTTQSMLTSNLTLYAKWIYVTAITFDNQGATTSGTALLNVKLNDSLPTITVPTKTSYVFDGYYTAVNGGGTKYYNANGTPAIAQNTFTVPTTLYAKWRSLTYTLTYNNNGGSGCTSKTISNGSTYATLCTPVSSTYAFLGWWTSPTGGTRVIDSTVVNVSGNQTLYAHWTTYAVKYFCHWTNYRSCCALEPGVGEFNMVSTLCTEACNYINPGTAVVFGPNEITFGFNGNTFSGYVCNCGTYTGYCGWAPAGMVLAS